MSFGRQSNVNRTGNFFHHRHDGIGKTVENARVLAAQLDLNLLAPAAKAAGIHIDRRTANLFHLIANNFPKLNLTDRPGRLGHHSHIDIPDVCGTNRAACLLARTRSTHGRERVTHEIGVGAHHARRLLGLQSRVFQIRAGRRLNLHRQFTAIRIRHKSKAAVRRLQPDGADKCERRQAHHRPAMPQSPSNDVRVLVRHPLKPRVEFLELTRNPIAVFAFFLFRVGPVCREHRIERE